MRVVEHELLEILWHLDDAFADGFLLTGRQRRVMMGTEERLGHAVGLDHPYVLSGSERGEIRRCCRDLVICGGLGEIIIWTPRLPTAVVRAPLL
jgi:hypothetical protein